MHFPSQSDDETIIPQQRLKFLLGQLTSELDKIQLVFRQYLPGQFNISTNLDQKLLPLRVSADELGHEYSFLVEKLIDDYKHFCLIPDQERLDRLFSDIKSLQLLLAG